VCGVGIERIKFFLTEEKIYSNMRGKEKVGRRE
jgi:hypothetical protein